MNAIHGAHRRLGVHLGIAAALIVLLAVLPAGAQSPESPGLERNGFTAWFNDPGLNTGRATANRPDVGQSGTFIYTRGAFDIRTLRTVTITGTGVDADGKPAFDANGASLGVVDPDCRAPQVSGSSTPSPDDPNTHTFNLSVSSACNITVGLVVRARADAGGSLSAKYATMTTDVVFAVPATPVTDVGASVPDLDTRDVTVTWSPPDGSAPDASYEVQRRGPGGEEWTTVGSASPTVDTVEDIGRYEYRVVADRPNTDPVPSAVAEVYVGMEPPTTTVPPTTVPGDPDNPGDPGDPTTTVTLPDSTIPLAPQGGSSSFGNPGVSSHSTVTVAPRSPVTTIDTGFEETLDYGLDDVEPGELAAEGQSILASDSDSSVIGPGAVGAAVMVLIGWAGHYVYFRRLAAQF